MTVFIYQNIWISSFILTKKQLICSMKNSSKLHNIKNNKNKILITIFKWNTCIVNIWHNMHSYVIDQNKNFWKKVSMIFS